MITKTGLVTVYSDGVTLEGFEWDRLAKTPEEARDQRNDAFMWAIERLGKEMTRP